MAAIRRKLKGRDDGDRQMVQILSCVRNDGLMTVEAACREAIDQGVHSAPVSRRFGFAACAFSRSAMAALMSSRNR